MLHRCLRTAAFATKIHAKSPTTIATRGLWYKSTTSRPGALQQLRERPQYTLLRLAAWATSAFLTTHILTAYVVSFGPCDGISMMPTINSFGDWVFVSKYHRRGRGIQVGDIISYTHPIMPETMALKRVAGLEGDFVLRDTPGTGQHEGEEKMLQVC